MGTASSQLSHIDTVTAQSGSGFSRVGDVDEFDMLAQSRNINMETTKTP